jgi:phospholipase/carboxylesterase
MSLESISIPPTSGKPAAGLLVVLHGYGADCHDLATLAPFLELPDYHLLFADAPLSYPYRGEGRMWYNLEQNNPAELASSRELLRSWLESLPEKTGVPLAKTILGGFSQGAAMTLDVGLNLPLAGLIVLSGYWHSQSRSETSSFPPVLLVHGTDDRVVPLSAAQQTRDHLESWGVAVDYHEFVMGHEIYPETLELMRNFVITNTQN